jgi:hypothetical protein
MRDKTKYLSNIAPFVDESQVFIMFKEGRRFLALIWDYSNELELLQNAGWTVFNTGIVTWQEFLIMSADTRLLSTPYWTCDCESSFLFSSLNTKRCSVCGAQYPHHKKGFYEIRAHFGWNNIHVFTPLDEVYDDYGDDDEEEYDEVEEIKIKKRPNYLRLVQLDQHDPKND